MKFLKGSIRIIILLTVALLAVFIFFPAEEIINGEGVAQDALGLVTENQRPITPQGVNQDWNNYISSFFFFLVSLDIYRKKSFIKMYCENVAKLKVWPTYKFIVSGLFFTSLILGIFSMISFVKYLPDIFSYVEWSKFLQYTLSSGNRHINVWSSGWSFELNELLSIFFYAGVIRLILILKKEQGPSGPYKN